MNRRVFGMERWFFVRIYPMIVNANHIKKLFLTVKIVLLTGKNQSMCSIRTLALYTLFCLVACWWPNSAKAAHIVGGELTYECLGYTNGDSLSNSRRYRFVMKVYRDNLGGGALFDGPGSPIDLHVTLYRGDTQIGVLLTRPNGPISPVVITEIDPNVGNPCLIVPPNVGVEEGVFEWELDLPIVDEAYTITYQRCCRNNTISNISDPGGSGSTYFIEISPLAQQTCNSSPTFDNFPPIVLCANEPFELDMSGTDKDGDLLVYSLCTPVLGGGNNVGPLATQPNGVAPDPDLPPPYTPVSFLAPTYTAQTPLGTNSILNYNSVSGLLSGQPENIGQFVVGICIEEYRNGILLSTVRRDFQFNVTFCENTVNADLREDAIDEFGNFVLNFCGDTEVEIVNESTQLQYITDYLWKLKPPTGDTIFTNTRNGNFTVPELGTYEGTMIVNPNSLANCSDTAYFELNIFPEVTADFNFAYDTCVAGPVEFTDLSTVAADNVITRWDWSFGDGNNSNQQNPDHRYQTAGNLPVRLLVEDNNACTDEITKPINYFPVPPLLIISPSAARSCVPDSILFTNLSVPITEEYDIEWDFGDGGTSDEISPIHSYETEGVFDVYVAITSPIGCFTDTLFPQLIQMDPSPVAGFRYSPEEVGNLRPEVSIFDESSEAISWFYQIGDEYSTRQREFDYTFRDTGVYEITQIVTHPSGCQDSLTQLVDVVPQFTFYMPNAFSPNGDGLNDKVAPKAILFGARSYQLRIWNRWGQNVFETTDPDEAWDGTSDGRQPAPGGVYLYDAQVVNSRNEIFEYRGTITLIR